MLDSHHPGDRNELSLANTAGGTWFLLDSGPGDAAFNMALDEALLEAMPRLGKPVLRFYAWNEPAASFGYFQKHAEVARMTLLRPLVRRPTGGGIVPHDADWTYSLSFPVTHEWYACLAVESYRRVHEWIRIAFERLGLRTELAGAARKAAPGQCFVGFEKSDVLWRGKKIAGAAQRRTRQGLLIQGSVQPPSDISRQAWEQAMLDGGAQVGQASCLPVPAASSRGKMRIAGIQWQVLKTDQGIHEQALRLVESKYSRETYNSQR